MRTRKSSESELSPLMLADAYGGCEHEVFVSNAAVTQFFNRLRKNMKAARRWAVREDVLCFRVYDCDLPEYRAAIDVYVDWGQVQGAEGEPGSANLNALAPSMLCNALFVHIAEYRAPSSVDEAKAQSRLDDMIRVAPFAIGTSPNHVFSKVRQRDRGGSQYAVQREPFVFTTAEYGLLFEVDMNGYLDTGLFLDHRVTRKLVGELSSGKRVLNLFAYTGSATVHAAAGGARATVTVDLSRTYLDWARRNMQANGFTGTEHIFQKGDTLRWLDEAASRGFKFDLVFVDPPTFSNSKAMGGRTWDVQRDHIRLLGAIEKVLSSNGIIVFSCNLRSFKPDVDGIVARGLSLTDISDETIPQDFARNGKIHKCYVLRRPGCCLSPTDEEILAGFTRREK